MTKRATEISELAIIQHIMGFDEGVCICLNAITNFFNERDLPNEIFADLIMDISNDLQDKFERFGLIEPLERGDRENEFNEQVKIMMDRANKLEKKFGIEFSNSDEAMPKIN